MPSNAKKILFVLFTICGIAAISELVFWAVGDNEKIKLNNTLAYLESRDEPIGIDAPLDWPDRALMVRKNDGDAAVGPMRIGGRTITNVLFEPKSELIYPEDLSSVPRVFVVGGSAAFGYLYHSDSSFCSLLNQHFGGTYQFINAAQVGWSSGQLYPVVQRIVDHYNPAALIIMSGNNEWVYWTPETELDKAQYDGLGLFWFCSTSHTLSWFAYRALMQQKEEAEPAEGDFAIHQQIEGWSYALAHPLHQHSDYNPADWPATKSVFLDAFEYNLKSMINYAEQRDVHTYVLNVPFNHKLSVAWKAPQPLAYNSANREAMAKHFDAVAQELRNKHPQGVMQLIDQPYSLEPEVALTYYLYATALEQIGMHEDATNAYATAREKTMGNLGGRISINERIARSAIETNGRLVDVDAAFVNAEQALGGHYNEHLIHDDCHPNPTGHRVIAGAVATALSTERRQRTEAQ